MTILGIDAALTSTGLAIVEWFGVPGRERVIATQAVLTERGDVPGDDVARARRVGTVALECAMEYGAGLVGLELPYIPRWHQTGDVPLRLASLGGVIEAMLAAGGYRVVRVQASSRAKALGVSGRAPRGEGKRRCMEAVLSRYGLQVSEDEADAIGVALAAVRKAAREDRPAGQARMKLRCGRTRRAG